MVQILVLGATGMIGHKMMHVLSHQNNYRVIGASRREYNKDSVIIDIRDFVALKNAIKKIKPNIIVNCCGLLITESEQFIYDAIKLNALLPHFLVDLASANNFKLIQISTDCVFSGKDGPYQENAKKDATDVYGKTKGLGEIDIEKHLTIRTSAIGPDLYDDGKELFHWFVNQKGPVNGYSKSFWSGVTTVELAKSVLWSVENDIEGLKNLTSNKPISKYELLNIINEALGGNSKIRKTEGPCHNKGLVNTTNFFYTSEVNYRDMIVEMVSDIEKRKTLYPHYKINLS